jgi:hypothetical protein
MILYAVQWHRAPVPPHEDENDLDWATWPGHDDYLDEGEANEAAREFDDAFDGAYVHRVVARRVDGPSVARTRGAPVGATSASSVDGKAAELRRSRAPRRA